MTYEATIDAFAGGGGASTGIEQAYAELGLFECVTVAVNHDADALAMHAANHLATLHLREDVFKADCLAHVGRQPVRLLWLSPDCKHFSKAKGGKPVEKRIRGLAWAGVKMAKQVKPRVIVLENVEEFQSWGPLIQLDDGWYPDPARKGQTFQRFIGQLRALGYRVEWRELRACDYGTPTIRKRLFVVCRRDKAPITWPKATHGKGLRPYRTAAECIDWSIPCPSIFERKRPLAEATLRRIARGIQRYVIDAAEPFIVPIANYGSGLRVNPISEPLTTITANPKGGSHAVVAPTLVHVGNGERKGQAPRCMDIEKPLGTVVGSGIKHHLVTAFLAQHNTMPAGTVHAGHDARKPVSTISGKGSQQQQQQQVVTSHLVKLKGTCKDGQPVTAPAAGLVYVHGEAYQIVDIGMRMLSARELARAQGFPDSYVIDRGADGRPLTKSAQVRMIGNSVCPPLARAIVLEQFAAEVAAGERAAA